MRSPVGVHDMQLVDVLDLALFRSPPQRTTVKIHIQFQRYTGDERTSKRHHQHHQHGHVYQQARPPYTPPDLPRREPQIDFITRCVANQSARSADLVHHQIAGIDTCCAAHAVMQETLPDVATGGANLHAYCAVDAITPPQGLPGVFSIAQASWFTARRVVGDQ